MIELPDTARVKKELIGYLHRSGYKLVIPEVKRWGHADVIGLDHRGFITEYEIKISLHDLNTELWQIEKIGEYVEDEGTYRHTKLLKHLYYLDQTGSVASPTHGHKPNFFYMCVPGSLVSRCEEALESIPYGIVNADLISMHQTRRLTDAVVRSAQPLRSEPATVDDVVDLAAALDWKYWRLVDPDFIYRPAEEVI